MHINGIKKLLSQGEGLTLEFKLATKALPSSLFETVCAFLNRNGGTVILGVDDNGTIVGVQEQSLEAMSKDIANLSNNSTKISPTFLLQPNIVEVDGKKLIHVFVPASSQVHTICGKYYDRSADGDFVVHSHTKISELYLRKNAIYTENQIYKYLYVLLVIKKIDKSMKNLHN